MEKIKLKISSFENENSDIITALQSDSKFRAVKIFTTKKTIRMDKKDERYINSLDNIKIIFEKKNSGIFILMGNLQISYKRPHGAAFYLKKVAQDITNFEDVKGVGCSVKFVTIEEPTDIDEMHEILSYLNKHKDFEYNIGQFDEFMEVFEFYRKMSNELNNNFSFEIKKISKPYFFITVDVKDFKYEFAKEVYDQNKVLKGYKFDESYYLKLNNEVQEQVSKLIDIYIGDEESLKRIHRAGSESIYLSDFKNISEKNDKQLKHFNILNITKKDKEIVLSGELKSSSDYEYKYSYLNLYDMGQKIKIDSIANSLKLIKQSGSGSATELLEYLIGDEQMPDNKKERKTSRVKEKYMQGLDDSQRDAFLMATDRSPVSLIKGPPGTGKTHVINAIVQYITKELKEKVIISSQTHIAIDNVLDKLMQNHDLIIPNRITNRKNKYDSEHIDKTLYQTWAKKFPEFNKQTTNLNLAKAMQNTMNDFKGAEEFIYSEETTNSDFSVIGATTTTSMISGKKGLDVLNGFKWLIIDEVSKCPITEVLRYLPYVEKIIMVGDDYQLAPLLEFTKQDVEDLDTFDEDMFDKLQKIYEQSVFAKVLNKANAANRLVLLNENYRSLKQVLSTYNVFYEGKLINKREEVRPEKCHFEVNDNDSLNYESKDVMFVEVFGGQEQTDGNSRYNVEEIRATTYILEDLIKKTKNPKEVSVSAIFPYAAQINRFQKTNYELINKAKKTFKSFEIDTVDAFQGKETDVVLVNTVVADSTKRNFLNDFRRINVSMSRARDKLIIFGNSTVLKKIEMKISDGTKEKYFKRIIDYIQSEGTFVKYVGGKIENGNKSKYTLELA